MTGDELKQRSIAMMGGDLGKQYTALFQEFTALYLYWKEFLELFGTNDKRIDRLNKAASGFFRCCKSNNSRRTYFTLLGRQTRPRRAKKECYSLQPAQFGR